MSTKRPHLARRRKAVGFTQEQLAEALGVGRSTVVRWESGETDPQPWTQPRLAKALKVSVDDLSELLGEVSQDAVNGLGGYESTIPPDTYSLGFGVDPEHVNSHVQKSPANVTLTFNAELDDAVHSSRALWADDLRGAYVGPDAVGQANLIGPVGRWLLAPSPTMMERTGRTVRVGTTEVDTIRTTVRTFEKLDHDFGGGHVRTAAVQYLHSSIAPLLEGSFSAAVGRQLYEIATEATYKAGAMAYDVGLHSLARRYFVQALSLAHVSGDRALGGKVLALMSHQANFLGQYADAVELARAAKLGGHKQATPRIRSMYAAMEARALASLGDRYGCRKVLQEVERWFAQADNEHADPEWIGYFNEAELYNELAHCFAALGEAVEASRWANLALAEARGSYPRSQTFCRLAVAAAHLTPRQPRSLDVEQGCVLANTSLPEVARLKSHRIRTYLDTFNRRLERYADTQAAAGFRKHLAAVAGEVSPWSS